MSDDDEDVQQDPPPLTVERARRIAALLWPQRPSNG